MNRDQAFEALKLRVENPDLILHSLAVEAIMRSLARYFHDDVEMWGITGLVHDIDIERINGNKALHGKMGGDILEGLDFDGTIVYAVRAQNTKLRLARRRKIDKALFCASPMAELIMACAKSHPDKGMDGVDAGMVMKCYQDRKFAKDINRECIASCSELELSMDELVDLSISALNEIGHLLVSTTVG